MIGSGSYEALNEYREMYEENQYTSSALSRFLPGERKGK